MNAVVQTQVLAQFHHGRVIVGTPLRRTRIGYAEAGVRLRRVAVLIDGFVGGRAFVPANHGSYTSVTRANLRLPTCTT